MRKTERREGKRQERRKEGGEGECGKLREGGSERKGEKDS